MAAAQRRIAPRPPARRIIGHLQDEFGIRVRRLTEIDLGVYQVDREHGRAWVVRVFPPERPIDAAAGDAEILGFLAGHAFDSERVASDDPVSVLDDHAVLVTDLVPAVPRTYRREAIRAGGGLRRLGAMLAGLSELPGGPAAVTRPGGAWHHLADGSPGDEIEAARQLIGDCAYSVAPGDRADFDLLRRELADVDGGEGLPEGLIHPDFVLANVIATAEHRMVMVDWTGSGRGPRAWPLAFLLYAEGARGLPRIDFVVDGYRQVATLEPAELLRLTAMMRARPVVLAVWSYGLGLRTLAEAARAVTEARVLADAAAARAVAAFAR